MPTPQRTAPPSTLPIVALTILGALAQACFTASRGRRGAGAVGNAAERRLEVTRVRSLLVTRLTPLKSGPGVLVCEPVARGADSATADFGAGCARWLHLIVGGQGELGKTPAWWSVWHAQRELKKPDLRLNPDEAARLPRQLGITHAALGVIRGNSGHCTLTYRWWKMPGKHPVGQPVTVTGSQDQIVAGLPQIAARLCRGLGIYSPRVPSELGESASELRSLGALPWLSEEPNLTDAQRNSLIRLPMPQLGSSCFDRAHPLLLTGFMGLLYYGSRLDYDGVLDFGYGLTRRLPDNALVWSEFARRAWFSGKAKLVELPVKQLTPNLQRFPRSYLFRTADSYMQRIAGRPAEGRKVAEIAVRCSTRNPDAWLFLNGSIGDQTDAVRHARYIRDLTRDQLTYCSELYDESMPIVIQAIRLDPQYASAWSTISEAAAFQGNNRLADGAFWKALALDPGCESTYEWGLQLYQPKWLNDEESLAQVVRTAAAAGKHWPYVSRFEIAWEAIIIGDQIHRPGLGHLAKPLLQTDAERAELQRAVEKYNRQSRTGH